LNVILVIDDELVNPSNELRGELVSFGEEYRYEITFIEAPEPEKLKDEIDRRSPAVIFLDIKHKGKPYNIARLLRQEIGHEIPILIFTNYTKKQLIEDNKKFEKIGNDLKEKAGFVEQEISKIGTALNDNSLKREARVALSNKVRALEILREHFQNYVGGISKKSFLLDAIGKLIVMLSDDSRVVHSLKKLKVSLEPSSMPEYFGSKYPTDFRQIIGYAPVLKDNFRNMRERINNGIASSTNPDNSMYSLDVSSPTIRIQDFNGNTIGTLIDKAACDQLEKYTGTADLSYQYTVSEVEKARREEISRINNSIYDATKWKMRDFLKNAGEGKYKLDIGRFVYNGKVLKDFEKSPGPDVSVKLDKIVAFLKDLTEKVEVLEQRVGGLEKNSKKK
jgi:CheY-like chemotaxis protein